MSENIALSFDLHQQVGNTFPRFFSKSTNKLNFLPLSSFQQLEKFRQKYKGPTNKMLPHSTEIQELTIPFVTDASVAKVKQYKIIKLTMWHGRTVTLEEGGLQTNEPTLKILCILLAKQINVFRSYSSINKPTNSCVTFLSLDFSDSVYVVCTLHTQGIITVFCFHTWVIITGYKVLIHTFDSSTNSKYTSKNIKSCSCFSRSF